MHRARLLCTLAALSLLFVADCAATGVGPGSATAQRASALPQIEGGATDTVADDAEPFGPPRPEDAALEVEWAKALPPLEVLCANTGARAPIRLYDARGTIDAEALDAFSAVAADVNGIHPLNPRLAQLAVKAAHHFGAKSLTVVSGYRKPRSKAALDHHARGEALDFRLPGTDYRKLAAYLRSLPRVGVGVYTDPRTRYVHLDVRDRSFHWLDASPPGVTWREAPLADPKQATRDATYTGESDLPLEPPI
jgi:hypothetical protein